MTAKFLKLVGPDTYNSLDTGIIRNGDIIQVDDEEELYERLLAKETVIDDDFSKPWFKEVNDPRPKAEQKKKAPTAAVVARQPVSAEESGDLGVEDLSGGKQKAQAPVGQGDNQAENLEPLDEVDSVDEGAKDPAYHESEEDGEEEGEGETDGEDGESSAKPKTQRRVAGATKKAK